MTFRAWPLFLSGSATSLGLVLTVLASGAMASGGQAREQLPQFRATVSRVHADVIVTDNNDGFVADLKRDDFVLFEDGDRQELLSVELVDLGSREVRELVDSGSEAVGGPAAVSSVVQPGRFGAIVFLIDMPDLYFSDKNRFADALISMHEKANVLKVPYAIYFIDQAGKLREVIPLTESVGRLLAGSRDLRAEPLARSRDDILRLSESYVNPSNRPEDKAQRRIDNVRERARSFDTYEMLARMLSGLAARTGRTAMVWVSNGVEMGSTDMIEGRPRQAQNTQERRAPEREWMNFQPDPRIGQLQETVYRAANTANVSVYAVDPSRLADLMIDSTGLKSRAGSSDETTRDSLRHIAAATGGEAYIADTDLEAVLRDIEGDTSRFYLLTYAPSHDAIDGEYHEIRVEVRRDDVRIRARPGYTHYDEASRHSRMINAALDLPGTVAGFGVVAEATRAWTAEGEAFAVLHVAVEGEDLAVDPGAQAQFAPVLYAIVRDESGRLVAQSEEPFKVGAVPSADPPAVHRLAWRLAPGRYAVSAVVHDRLRDRLGATRLDLEIPDVGARWHTSDPALLVKDGAGGMAPVVGGRLLSGQAVVVYVEVYNAQAPVLRGTIRTVDPTDGEATAPVPGPGSDLPESALRREGGVHSGSLALPRLPPGEYVIDIEIEDGPASERFTVPIPIRVLAAGE